jgi:hypothetical protein
MRGSPFFGFHRNLEAGDLIENFLVSSASAIILLRIFLNLANYPQIDPGGLHVAHMLFGGIIMMLSIIAQLIFLDREIRHATSITGGIGFGIFIDEIGKFITRDHNYFYRPTFAIIYVIFISIFLITRVLEKLSPHSPEEYTINAVEILKSIISNRSSSRDNPQILNAINLFKNLDLPFISDLRATLIKAIPFSKEKNSLIFTIKSKIKESYKSSINNRYFVKLIIWMFVAFSSFQLISSLSNLKRANELLVQTELLSSSLSGIIVLVGLQNIIRRTKIIFSYKLFKFSILISIFITQFLRFMNQQLSAVIFLILDLLALNVFQHLIQHKILPYQEKIK